MSKIVILEFREGKIYIFSYDELYWECPEDFLIEKGFEIGNCQFMVSDNLSIEIK